jgi:RHS repeat-associated protein
VGRQWYHPFGTVRAASGSLPTDYGFTGERRHAATGWVQLGVRWLDPETGRFTSADTIVPEPGNPQTPGDRNTHHDRHTHTHSPTRQITLSPALSLPRRLAHLC